MLNRPLAFQVHIRSRKFLWDPGPAKQSPALWLAASDPNPTQGTKGARF